MWIMLTNIVIVLGLIGLVILYSQKSREMALNAHMARLLGHKYKHLVIEGLLMDALVLALIVVSIWSMF